jgi:hypothetical protein
MRVNKTTSFTGMHEVSNRSDINCGGYALRTMDWLLPEDYGYDDRDLDEMIDFHEDLFNLKCVGVFTGPEALEYYKNNLDNYVLYRISYDFDDFHWITVTKRLEFYNKSGTRPAFKGKVLDDSRVNPFGESWFPNSINYESPILMFKWTGPAGLK